MKYLVMSLMAASLFGCSSTNKNTTTTMNGKNPGRHVASDSTKPLSEAKLKAGKKALTESDFKNMSLVAFAKAVQDRYEGSYAGEYGNDAVKGGLLVLQKTYTQDGVAQPSDTVGVDSMLKEIDVTIGLDGPKISIQTHQYNEWYIGNHSFCGNYSDQEADSRPKAIDNYWVCHTTDGEGGDNHVNVEKKVKGSKAHVTLEYKGSGKNPYYMITRARAAGVVDNKTYSSYDKNDKFACYPEEARFNYDDLGGDGWVDQASEDLYRAQEEITTDPVYNVKKGTSGVTEAQLRMWATKQQDNEETYSHAFSQEQIEELIQYARYVKSEYTDATPNFMLEGCTRSIRFMDSEKEDFKPKAGGNLKEKHYVAQFNFANIYIQQ